MYSLAGQAANNDADDGNRTTGVSLVVVKLALRAIEFWREADTSHSLGI